MGVKMKYTTLGKSGLKISTIGLGTWQFDPHDWIYYSEFRRKDAINLVHRALDLGVTFIDTAETYGRGKSESILGEALKGRRDETVIATKFLPLTIRPSKIRDALKRSLTRLQIDMIDLYQIHYPVPYLSQKRLLQYGSHGKRGTHSSYWRLEFFTKTTRTGTICINI